MDKFIAVVFDTEEKAYAGSKALGELYDSGDIVVYAAGVIAKDSDGQVSIKKAADDGPIGTAFGIMLGAMVGVLAGPLAVATGAAAAGTAAAAGIAASGMAAGSITGGIFGMYDDLYGAGIDAEYLESVSAELSPGKSALVASIEEAWTTPLDSKMNAAGGVVFRKARIVVMDEQYEREIKAMDAELSELEEELEAAEAEARANLSAKIEATKTKMKSSYDKTVNRLVKLDDEFNARQKALDERISNSLGDTKDKFVKRKAALQADYQERSGKLKEAAALAKSALT